MIGMAPATRRRRRQGESGLDRSGLVFGLSSAGSGHPAIFPSMCTHHVRKTTEHLLAAFLFSGCVLGAAQRPTPEFRLRNAAHPTRYQLDLTILPNQSTFHGSAIIGIDLAERTGIVWLNAKDLTIQEVIGNAQNSFEINHECVCACLPCDLADFRCSFPSCCN